MTDGSDDLLARLPKPASASTLQHQAKVAAELVLDDPSVAERAARGRIADLADGAVDGAAGLPVWDLGAYGFLDAEAPDTVNPSLWRQAQLNAVGGLFEVAEGIYQVRGLDLANITFVAGDTGWVVIDPLTAAETASAALALVTEHLGERPVRTVVYTHSHVDHFGGVRGIVSEDDVASGAVSIVAPAGFLTEAVSENVVAGNAMGRRGSYMYGALLPKGPQGHVDSGIGKGIPTLASTGLLPPTEEVGESGTVLVLDGVRFEFQMASHTEAPSELNFLLPDHRVLCMAENCTATLHNLSTPRGTQVRDGLAWSAVLHDAIERFEGRADVMFCCHNWPTWGGEAIVEHLARHRDAYRFIHDQAMRLANHGLTSLEIAEELESIGVPGSTSGDLSLRNYYGTVSHNAKAVYQRYLGWYDAHPSNLHPLPPEPAAKRYLDYMGGADAVVARARDDFESGDYRWVAQVLHHVVFADPDHTEARLLLADTFEQLGYQAESAPWRDMYLTGAHELRNGTLRGIVGSPGTANADVIAAMSVEMLLQLVGVRLDGPAVADIALELELVVPDHDQVWKVGLSRGAIHHVLSGSAGQLPARSAEATRLTIDHAPLAALAQGTSSLEDLIAEGRARLEGPAEGLHDVLDALDTFEFWFDIVTP